MDISSLREKRCDSALTVTELNSYLKSILENDRMLPSVTVKGEISNFIYHRSGHLYFTLKDSEAQIKTVMFRFSAVKLRFMPENGMKVIVHGSVNIYTKDGSVQLYANQLQPDGVGALYLAYEQMKERLSAEGLFDPIHKKPLPKIPSAIGVITSPTGAAIRDILNVLGRRFPYATVYLYPALVQGEGAEEALTAGVDYFDRSGLVDVVIIGRGGGSIEDLWAFNSESLARRIYSSRVPIISAVGHETDFTICDFVSDLRAPTPSAAAELAVPDEKELYMRIASLCDKASSALTRTLDTANARLDKIKANKILVEPSKMFDYHRKYVAEISSSVNKAITRILDDKKKALVSASVKADALSPLSTLKRGYSVATVCGKVVKSNEQLEVGDKILLKLYDGEALAEIKAKGAHIDER